MEKIKLFFSNIKTRISPKLLTIDTRIQTFLPNPKMRKVLYISVCSLFGFMFLIIFLGLLLSPLKNNGVQTTIIKKPAIISESPKPETELTETQKAILKLETEIRELKFPNSSLNMPILEQNIGI